LKCEVLLEITRKIARGQRLKRQSHAKVALKEWRKKKKSVSGIGDFRKNHEFFAVNEYEICNKNEQNFCQERSPKCRENGHLPEQGCVRKSVSVSFARKRAHEFPGGKQQNKGRQRNHGSKDFEP